MAFVHCMEASAQDDALDVLDALLQELFTGAAKAEKTHRLRTLKEQDLSTWVLVQVCQTVMDPEVPDSQVRAVAFGKKRPSALVVDVRALMRQALVDRVEVSLPAEGAAAP